MTEREPVPARFAGVVQHPLVLWAAFIVVHLALGLLNLRAPGLPLGDVTLVYSFWADQAYHSGFLLGIDSEWVYPILALIPMLLSGLAGPDHYGSTWLSLILVANAIGFAVLTGWGRRPERAAVGWWWIAFLLLLGPIAIGRIDAVTVPLAMIGMLLLATRPVAAGVLLAIATWVKVWPAALIGSVLIAATSRARVLLAGLLVTFGVLAATLMLGSGANVLSFITQQTGRGLQVEAPVSTIWLWLARLGFPNTAVYYDTQILTFQVEGPGTEIASAVMTPLLVIVVTLIALLGMRALRSGATVTDLLPPLALAMTTAFIAINKVGSPQFVSWLAVPVIYGLVTQGRGFRIPATLTLVVATLTHVVYPYLYNWLLGLHPTLVLVVSVRNVLYFVVLAWALRSVIALARPRVTPVETPAVLLDSSRF